MIYYSQRTFLVAFLLLTVGLASRAQGLGGLLNRASGKVGQASQTVGQSSVVTGPDRYPANGEDPPTPPEMTVQTEEEYTRILLADPRPVVRGSSSYTAAYRQLHQLQHFPVKFTWDQPALARCVETRIWLNGYIADACTDLVSSLNGTTYEVYLRPRMAKIKEIHFTPSDKQRSLDSPGEEQGWFYSFNPATGVLTAGFGEYASSVSAWSSLTKWIVKNVK